MNAEQLTHLIRESNQRWGAANGDTGNGHAFATNPGGEPTPDRCYGWSDGPWPVDEDRPKRRPFEELIIELAERTGRPLLRVDRVTCSSVSKDRDTGRAR